MKSPCILLVTSFLITLIQSHQAIPMTLMNLPIHDFKMSINDTAENIWTKISQDPKSAEKILNTEMNDKEEHRKLVRDSLLQMFSYENNEDWVHSWVEIDATVIKIDVHFSIMWSCYLRFIREHESKDNYYTMAREYLLYTWDSPRRLIHSVNWDFENMLFYLRINFEKHSERFEKCTFYNGLSIQQLIDNCQQIVQAAEIKVSLVLRMAFEIYKASSNETLTFDDLEKIESDHIKMIQEFRKIIHLLPRDIRVCDPFNYYEDYSYMKLNYVFQGYIVNQLYTLENRGNCRWSNSKDFCGGTNPVKTHENSGVTSGNRNKCSGELWDCKKRFYNDDVFDSSSKLFVCLADQKTHRRYKNAYVGDGKHYYVYDRGYCDSVEEYAEVQDEPANCNVCYCVCADKFDYKNNTSEDLLSDRAFSLLPVFSNILENYVITGARLRKKFGVVHIQIQQGLLLSNGSVNSTTMNWKEVSDADLLNPSYQFHLNWNNSRSIQLEDIDLPSTKVLVGLSFNVTFLGNMNRLRLTAYGSSFDYCSGNLDSDKTFNYWGKNFEFSKPGINVHEKLVPLKHSNDAVVTNKSISFDISNLQTDLGQTLIPFIDIQEVTTSTPTRHSYIVLTPMGGAGLYYKYPKENNKNAGYIGLKLKTYDFTAHM